MQTITRKADLTIQLNYCLEAYKTKGMQACLEVFHERLLKAKVKFPLLEHCAAVFFEQLEESEHIPFCDKISALNTEGGNVILGIILQKRLTKHFEESIAKTVEYIIAGDFWYVSDIIGERVFGYALLTRSDDTLAAMNNLSKHDSHWVVRSLGAGSHYAIKKGLEKSKVQPVFELLLSTANSKNKQIKQGIGWAAKTTAKFHPDIIEIYRSQIDDESQIPNWFRKKIQIGLDYNTWKNTNPDG